MAKKLDRESQIILIILINLIKAQFPNYSITNLGHRVIRIYLE